MKSFAVIVITLLAFCQFSEAFLCYEQDVGGDRSVTFCSNSCYSVGGSVAGVSGVKKGCADNTYETSCQSAGLPGGLSGLFSEHTCFCNYMLCNSSSMPSLFLPLLVIPYLLQKLI